MRLIKTCEKDEYANTDRVTIIKFIHYIVLYKFCYNSSFIGPILIY